MVKLNIPNSMRTFTIVYVHHEDPSVNAIFKASVWIGEGDRPTDELPEESNGWFRLIGPIEMKVADEISDSLSKFLQHQGFKVKNEMIAD
jgi:hypothetical protein